MLEDMLGACVLDHKGSWEEHLPLVEFAYNNSYQASIQMAPYKALYGRPCRSPICWTEVGESSITRPDLIRNTSEKVSLRRQRLLTVQSRQKSYADVRRRPLEFEFEAWAQPGVHDMANHAYDTAGEGLQYGREEAPRHDARSCDTHDTARARARTAQQAQGRARHRGDTIEGGRLRHGRLCLRHG